MMVRVMKRWMMTGASVALFCSLVVAQGTTPSGTLPLNSIVEALEKTQAAQFSYQVIREYRLFGPKNSQINSDVVAEVNFKPPASTNYRIQKASGSNRGQQVVRDVLDHEVKATSRGNQARIALSSSNYDFSYIGETVLDGQPCYRLGLKPKRKENELISGEAWIDKNSFFVRQIEGEVAKTPSWWLRRVRVKLAFAEVEGTWLQTSMEAVADVRIVGPHTLTSRILDYRGQGEIASTTRVRSTDRKR
jgi:outer membrane lipoprotein-sorting protein